MRKLIVATIAVSALLMPSLASAKIVKQVERTTWELSDFPGLQTAAKTVCDNKATKSDKLKLICASGQFPSVTKAGNFRNTGTGAELNTLIRQLQDDNRQ